MGTGWLNARNHAIEGPDRPKVRTIEAAAATGMIVQLRIRPRLAGSAMSPGMEDRNSDMSASNSAPVTIPAVVAALLISIAVEPIPAWFMSFQIGPLLPSIRP